MMATPSVCYSVLTSILAATAFLLCWASEFGCSFISFTSTSGFNEPVSVQFGLWAYQFWTIATSVGGSVIFETCHRYPDSIDVDGNWKAARAFATLAIIFGGIAVFANLISACVSPLRKTSKWEAPVFFLAALFQGLSLLLLNSVLCNNNTLVAKLEEDAANLGNTGLVFPDTCSISTGANCAIAAICFWLASTVTSRMSVVAEKREEDGSSAGTEPLIPGENL